MNDEMLLPRKEVEKMTKLSRSEIYRRMAEATFPRPLQIGPHSVAWRRSDVLRWIAALPERKPR